MSALGRMLRKAFAWFMFFMAFLLLIPVVNAEEGWPAALFMVAAAALGGGMLLRGLRRESKAAERAAEIERQLAVLRLADAGDGSLTATEVATRLGWPIDTALATLRALDDGARVTSTVTDEGIILFEFMELIHDPTRPRDSRAAVAPADAPAPRPAATAQRKERRG
ncbi:MAG TPA: hypothetical protein VF006_11540 [Longimicrobium sp.]